MKQESSEQKNMRLIDWVEKNIVHLQLDKKNSDCKQGSTC
jgi:hypothetical protein